MSEKLLDAEERFTDASSANLDDFLKPSQRRSSYLSSSSVFDTLTDSILADESDISILDNEGAMAELRRGK